MNDWPFVIAAYAVMLLAGAGLVLWAGYTMRAAERAADAVRRDRQG